MKFDYVIGNPPYNQEAKQTSTSDDPIYHIFMDSAYEISDKTLLITPARFLSNAGKTPTNWNKKMLSDKHLKVEYYEFDSTKVFQNALIPGGIAITYRDTLKNFGAIDQFITFNELRNIDQKVKQLNESTMNTIIYSQNKFNLETLYKDHPKMKEMIGSDGKDKRFRQKVMERFPFLFHENSSNDCIKVLGLISKQREYRYIERKYVLEEDFIDKYKVFVPFSNGASGTLGDQPARLISKPVLGLKGEGMTQTFIGIGKFETIEEAQNLHKYILSKFCRVLLGILKVTQGNKAETWAHVPLQDFTNNSDIDWSKSVADIDKQLYAKYGLTDEEIAFIESHIKEMA